MALNHYTEVEGDGRERRATILAYPKYYQAGQAFAETQERFVASASGYFAEATEGVHTLRVGSDGTEPLHGGRGRWAAAVRHDNLESERCRLIRRTSW